MVTNDIAPQTQDSIIDPSHMRSKRHWYYNHVGSTVFLLEILVLIWHSSTKANLMIVKIDKNTFLQ